MTRERTFLAVAVAAATLLGVVAHATAGPKKQPPKGKVTIKGCQKKKKPVVFDHAKHVKFVRAVKKDCQACHHLVDKKPATKDRCSDCHLKKQGKLDTCQVSSPKKNPFHKQCITCHKQMAKAPKPMKKGPTKCKQCHVK